MTAARWSRGLAVVCAIAGTAAFVFGRNPSPAAAAVTGQIGELTVPGFDVASLPDADFEKLHRAAAPGKERWAEIPWETDLAVARARSAREAKPLLMWIMDGHPLGCT